MSTLAFDPAALRQKNREERDRVGAAEELGRRGEHAMAAAMLGAGRPPTDDA